MAHKNEPGSGGSNGLCMIDPVVLGGVINDLATMEAAIATEMKGLKTEFEKVGVSAKPITDLLNVSHWLHEQLPMLRRRHKAALLLSSQGLQFTSGTNMLSMPENPDDATKQGAILAVQRVRDALNGKPPGRDGVAAAVRTLQRIKNAKGPLSPEDLLFLETFYKGLGKDVYKVPDYIKNDDNWVEPTRTTYAPGEIIPTSIDPKTRTELAAAAVSGLLTLSDERRGGSWNRLPKFVQEAASDPYKEYVHEGSGAGEMSGGKARELAAFLTHAGAGDRGGVVLSKRLAITAIESVNEYLKLQLTAPGRQDDEVARTFLQIAGRNEQAMHDMLTGKGMKPPAGVRADIYKGYAGAKDFLVPISTHAWSDDGKAAAAVFGWIADAKASNDPTRQALAKESMRSLVTTLTDPEVIKEVMDIRGVNEDSPREALGVVNPELARSLARDSAAFLTEFSDPGAAEFALKGVNKMGNGEQVAARFFTLVATDDKAAEALAGAIYRNNIDGIHQAMARPDDAGDYAKRAGQLQGLLDSALQNVALERTDSLADAQARAAEIRGDALAVVGIALDATPGLPGGLEGSVGIADKILGHYLSSETPTIEPHQLQIYGIDEAAYSSEGLVVRYEFAKALLESGKLKPEDLPPEVRSDDIPPRLKSPGEFESKQYNRITKGYDNAASRTPAGAIQGNFLSQYQEIYARAIREYRADSRGDLYDRVGIG